MHSWSLRLVAHEESDTGKLQQYIACRNRFVATSCAFNIHRTDRGKPLLISILACSLGFQAITSERGTFTKIAIFKMKPV